jgi:hypothetical protein
MPAEFYKWLGIDEPPQKGDYFVAVYNHLKHLPRDVLEKVLNQLDVAMERPWTAKQFPELAKWLHDSAKPLELVRQAEKRSHYYSPFVTTDSKASLLSTLLPGVQRCRDLATAFSSRAMLRLSQGEMNEAWQDLLACHRLGRQVARGGTSIEQLVGIAIDRVASDADLAYLEYGKLSAKQIKDCLRDLQQLPPMPSTADKVDLCERMVMLQSISLMHQHGPQVLANLGLMKPEPPGPLTMLGLHRLTVDWELALRNVNHWCNRFTVALRLKDRAAREKELNKIGAELEEIVKTLGAIRKGQVPAGQNTGITFNANFLSHIMVGLILPAFRKVQDAADRSEQVERNLHVAFALAAYQDAHGSFPKKLAALAPAFLANVPQDLFSGKALVYQPAEKGYLLYSVGLNGKDDQGRTYDDNPPGDDIVVRMPLPKLSKN